MDISELRDADGQSAYDEIINYQTDGRILKTW